MKISEKMKIENRKKIDTKISEKMKVDKNRY